MPESFEARWRSYVESLPPETVARFQNRIAAIRQNVEGSRKYQKGVLRRLGVKADVEDGTEHHLREWAMARAVGISEEEYWGLSQREIYAILEARADLQGAQQDSAVATRSKRSWRGRVSPHVIEMREARYSHEKMCERLDGLRLPTPPGWGQTWMSRFRTNRRNVDSTLSKLR